MAFFARRYKYYAGDSGRFYTSTRHEEKQEPFQEQWDKVWRERLSEGEKEGKKEREPQGGKPEDRQKEEMNEIKD